MGMKKFLLGLVGIVCALFTISAHALPAGYTELQYIESTGTQYIDTGITGNVTIRATAQQTQNTGSSQILFGTTPGGEGGSYFGTSGDSKYWGLGVTASVGASSVLGTTKATIEVVFESTGASATINNESVTRGASLTQGNLTLFSAPAGAYIGRFKLWSTKVYKNNTLVRDLIPAKRNSDSVIGMYDTVNNRFYTNAGTGSFAAGPIACDGELVTYTSATGTVTQNGTPTPTNPITPTFYTQGNMILRAVGSGENLVADSYDASTGKITRRVGYHIFTGDENFGTSTAYGKALLINAGAQPWGAQYIDKEVLCNYFKGMETIETGDRALNTCFFNVSSHFYFRTESSAADFKTWLKGLYDAGTPVIVYYPLATPVVEDWTETSYCYLPIKVASTKYVESQFSALNTVLANAVATVNTVVTQTIAQAASIATLQSGKQTRPADNTECPAYKQCLLVEDENGTPHWYQITDPFRDFVAPIIANNVAPASTTNQPGYTQLQYIESTGTQYIDTGVIATNWDWSVEFEMSVPQAGDMFFGAGRGIWASTDWGAQFGLANSSGNTNWGAGSGGMKVVVSVLGVRTNTFYKYKITKEGLYVNGELKSQNTATESFSNSDLSLWICKTNNIGTSGYNNSASSWKYVRIYNANNALVFNGIPAKRNSDGAIGMYDTVTKTFFANAGSGTFTAGPVVANTDVPANPTWTATWAANATTGVAAGTITGEGLCNGVSGTYGIAATSSQLSNANWNTTGAGCWCKVSGLTVGEEYSAASSSSWVFYYTFGSTAGCASDCALNCANNVRSYASFRSAVFGM